MSEQAIGIREGEIAVELPVQYDASLYFIGRIRTPWTDRESCPKNARKSDAVCSIEVDPRWAPALAGIESCTHIIVLYWMQRSRRDLVVQVPRHYGVGRGTFALRSPARPNPIALSVARLVGVSDRELRRGSRLHGSNPPPRHQAVFCFYRRGCRRPGRLARGEEAGRLTCYVVVMSPERLPSTARAPKLLPVPRGSWSRS